MKKEDHPFACDYSGSIYFVRDTPSRLQRIREFSIEQLEAILSKEGQAMEPLQKTVQKAAESRLRKLQKQKGKS